MGKYKMMLVLPFVILVMISWLNIDAGNKELQKNIAKQNELLEKAQRLEDDKIYFRAAELVEEAKKIKTNKETDEKLELKLIYLYKSDGNNDKWEKLISSRIKNGNAGENEYIELTEYYENEKNYVSALDILKSAIKNYPDNSEFKALNNKIRGRYSFIKCDYSAIGAINNSKVAVCDKNGMWGFSSAGGGSAKEYIYTSAVSYAGEMGLVIFEDRPALINAKGKFYSYCHDNTIDGIFSYDGTSAVLCCGDKYKLADNELDTSEEIYDFLGTLSDKLRAYCLNGNWGFLDENGKEKISEIYSDIILNNKYAAFGQGIAFVSEGNGYIMIDKEGNRVGNGLYENAYPFSTDKNSPAAVMSGGKWGFINNKGEIVKDYCYDEAMSFSSGFAAVKKDGKWGYINMDFEEMIPCEYDEVRPFTGAVAAVKADGLWHFIKLDYYNE